MTEEVARPTARILKGPVHDKEFLPVYDKEFLPFEHEVVGVLRSLADGGGDVVDPRSPLSCAHRENLENLDEHGATVLNPKSGKGVIPPNQVMSMTLTVQVEVALGELISIEAFHPPWDGREEDVENGRCALH